MGDEILEINGNQLLGLPHQEAIDVIKKTPGFVQIVVCRPVRKEVHRDREVVVVNPTSECGSQYIILVLDMCHNPSCCLPKMWLLGNRLQVNRQHTLCISYVWVLSITGLSFQSKTSPVDRSALNNYVNCT